MAAEIEFAFLSDTSIDDVFWQAVLDAAATDAVPLESIGREQSGEANIQQYEVRFKHGSPSDCSKAVLWLNECLFKLSKKYDCQILSIDKLNDCSVFCGLHWHLHLLNSEDNYCFLKQEDQLSAALADTLGGLLHTMPVLMTNFAPTQASYVRLNAGADHVPTTQSWGGNNRSVALRLPESVIPLRHIEHRVCGADANPLEAAWAILIGVHYGLTHHPEPGEQCFGDANRPESTYPKLPMSLQEAEQVRESADWLGDYLTPEASS